MKLLRRESIDENGKKQTIKVGVIGAVTPQITQWDKANLDGKAHYEGYCEISRITDSKNEKEGADVIVVLAHTGMGDEQNRRNGRECNL